MPATRLKPNAECDSLLQQLVGRRTGILRDIALSPIEDGDACLFHAGATLAGHPSTSNRFEQTVGGSGPTQSAALMACLGEGCERYAASCYDARRPAIPSEECLLPAMDPAAFAPFSRRQYALGRDNEKGLADFPYRVPEATSRLRWVPARDLSSNSLVSVPASSVYLPYEPAADELLIGPGLSTGLACHRSPEAACLGGVCEVIERDALTLCWLRGLTPPRICSEWLRQAAGDWLPPRDDIEGFDLTTDIGLPVVLVVCRGRCEDGSVLSVGSACHPSAATAAGKAALEASQDRVYVRHLRKKKHPMSRRADFSDLTSFVDHAVFYSHHPEWVDHGFEFLSQARDTSHRPTDAEWIAAGDNHATDTDRLLTVLLSRLKKQGHRAVGVELSPQWGERLSLWVTKVLVPSLIPLHGHHGLPFLGHPRLADWQSAAPAWRKNHDREWWPFPHPFP